MWRSSPAGSRQFSWPRDETGHFGDQAQMGKFPGLTHSSHMINSSCDNIPVVLQAVAKVWEWKRGPGARFDVRGRTETEAKLPTRRRRPSCRIRLPPAVLSLNSFCSLFGRLSTGGTSWNDTPAASRAAGWRNPKCHHYQLAQREYRRLFLFRRMAWETRLILMFQEEAAGGNVPAPSRKAARWGERYTCTPTSICPTHEDEGKTNIESGSLRERIRQRIGWIQEEQQQAVGRCSSPSDDCGARWARSPRSFPHNTWDGCGVNTRGLRICSIATGHQ